MSEEWVVYKDHEEEYDFGKVFDDRPRTLVVERLFIDGLWVIKKDNVVLRGLTEEKARILGSEATVLRADQKAKSGEANREFCEQLAARIERIKAAPTPSA